MSMCEHKSLSSVMIEDLFGPKVPGGKTAATLERQPNEVYREVPTSHESWETERSQNLVVNRSSSASASNNELEITFTATVKRAKTPS
eukprot:2810534-Amphidinium_carterae.1